MLSPYRVLDLTDETSSFCGKVLADLCANVVKVEPPGGDPARLKGPFYHDIPDPNLSLTWVAHNTGKKSITLNLGSVRGRELFRALVRRSDFVLEAFPPGYMESIGLDYQNLEKMNPALIMASVTPFGQSGPYKEYRSSDLISLGLGGLMYSMGDPDRAPLRFAVEHSWPEVGLQAAMAVLIAHHYRRRTGEGQYIDISIQECITSMLDYRYHFVGYGGKAVDRRRGPRIERGGGGSAPLHIWPCKDGHICWRLFTAAQAAKTAALIEWMQEEGMGSDVARIDWKRVDFESLSQDRLDRYEAEFGEFFLTHTKEELHDEAIKRNIMLYPVSTLEDLMEDPQLAARGFWSTVEIRPLDVISRLPGLPAHVEPALREPLRRAPSVGEHNREVYQQELGLSEDKLTALQQSGVI